MLLACKTSEKEGIPTGKRGLTYAIEVVVCVSL